MTRPILTALVAEMHVAMRERPWDFFDHTDLLDFPGARSREHHPDIRKHFRKEGTLEGLFLRGKVAYLFDRYNAEQELTGMLLCIAPSNQEVRTLPAMIKEWIDLTHGADPAARARDRDRAIPRADKIRCRIRPGRRQRRQFHRALVAAPACVADRLFRQGA